MAEHHHTWLLGFGLSVITLCVLGGIAVICLHRNVHVSSRNPGLLMASLLSGLAVVVITLASYTVGNRGIAQVSCHAILWPSVMYIPAFALPYFLRAYVLYFNYTWRSEASTATTPGTSGFSATWFRLFKTRGALLMFGAYFAVLSITLVVIGIGASVAITSPETFYFGQQDCIPLYHRVVTTVEAVVYILLLLLCAWKLWPVSDVFGFKVELILAMVVSVPLAVIWILSRLIGFLSQVPNPVWPVLIYVTCMVVSIGVPLFQILRFRHLATRSDSASFVAMEMNHGISSSAEFLQLVLNNEDLCESLRAFMVTNWSVENLMFLIDVINYKDLTKNQQEMQAEAERIYALYLSPTADFELNIDFADKEAIMEAIEAKAIRPDTFEAARLKTFNVIRYDSVPRWRTTDDFKQIWENHRRNSSSKSEIQMVGQHSNQ